VTAAGQRIGGSEAGLRGARAFPNPKVELAPAVGFGDEAALLRRDLALTIRDTVRKRVDLGLAPRADV
jgi:hypothetical protein